MTSPSQPGGPNIAPGVTAAMGAAPELATTPGLALAAGQSAQPTSSAQTLALAASGQSTANSIGSLASYQASADISAYIGSGGQSLGLSFLSPSPAAQADQPGVLSPTTAPDVASIHPHLTAAHSSGILATLGHAVGRVAHDVNAPLLDIPGARQVEGAAAGGLNILSAPLREVQHMYRYFRAVVSDHGYFPALVELAGMAAAGVGASVLTGGNVEAGLLAAEGVGTLADHLFYKGDYAKTQVSYTDKAGHQVSFGRDLSNLVGLGNNSLVSGLGDASFDVLTDPLRLFGSYRKAVDLAPSGQVDHLQQALSNVTGGRLGRVVGRKLSIDQMTSGIPNDVTAAAAAVKAGLRQADGAVVTPGGVVPGVLDNQGRLVSVDEVRDTPDTILTYAALRPDVGRVFDMMAKSTPGEFTTNPILRPFAGMAAELGAAKDRTDVANVLRDNVNSAFYTKIADGLPKTSLTRLRAHQFNEWLYAKGSTESPLMATEPSMLNRVTAGKLGSPGTLAHDENGAPIVGEHLTKLGGLWNLFQSYHPFTVDSNLLKLSAKSINPGDAAHYTAVADLLRFSQAPSTVSKIMDGYVNGTLEQRRAIFTNAIIDVVRAAGVPDASPQMSALKAGYSTMDSTTGQLYGIGRDGTPIKLHTLDNPDRMVNMGLLPGHQGNWTIPDFNQLRYIVRSTGNGLTRRAANWDYWLANHYTNALFKPLALLNLGFATRVALAELVPGSMEYGAKGLLSGKLASLGAKWAPDVYAREFNDHLDAMGVRARIAHYERARNLTGEPVSEAEKAHWAAIDGYTPERRAIVAKDAMQRAAPNPRLGLAKHIPAGPVELYHRTPLGDIPTDAWEEHANLPSTEFPSEAFLRQRAQETINRMGGASNTIPYTSEIPHIVASVAKTLFDATRHVVGRTSIQLSKMLADDDWLDVAMGLAVKRGAILSPAISASHDNPIYLDAPTPERVHANLFKGGAKVPVTFSHTGAFKPFDINDENHPAYWSHQLHAHAADAGSRLIAKVYARNAHLGEQEAFTAAQDAFLHHLASKTGQEAHNGLLAADPAQVNPAEFAAARVEAVLGLTYGQNGQLNHDLLDSVAAGNAPSAQELNDTYRTDQRPAAVLGAVTQPVHNNRFETIVQGGFHRFIDPTINFISREPIYVAAVTKEYKYLKPLIASGQMTFDDALRISEIRGIQHMLPLIHNTLLRSQFSDVFRNVMPFYFAQEQAYRRYGTAALRNPGSFGWLGLAHHATRNIGIEHTDPYGKKYVVIPGANGLLGAFTAGAKAFGVPVDVGLPGTYSGSMSSLQTVLPDVKPPSLSPVASLAISKLGQLFPELNTDTSTVGKFFGGGYQATANSLMPNATIASLGAAAFGSHWQTSFASQFSYNIMAAAHQAEQLRAEAQQLAAQGKTAQANALETRADWILPGENTSPGVKEAALHRIQNSTRLGFIVKALYNATAPLSTAYNAGDWKIRSSWIALLNAHKGDYNAAFNTFIAKNPYALADTIGTTKSATGESLPTATAGVGQWLTDHASFVNRYSQLAAYLIPHAPGQYDNAVQQMEGAMNLTSRKSIPQILDSAYYASASPYYYQNEKDYINAYNAADGNYSTQKQIHTLWTDWQTEYFNAHPVMQQVVTDNLKKVTAVQVMNQLTQAAANGDVPAGKQTTAVLGILSDYNVYSKVYAGNAMQGVSNTPLRNAWFNYLNDVVKSTPNITGFVRGVLEQLPNPIISPSDPQEVTV